MKVAKLCDVYVVMNKTDFNVRLDKCDVIETKLKELWHDKNDCAGVYCAANSSAGASVCIDRLGYFECVDQSGKILRTVKPISSKF